MMPIHFSPHAQGSLFPGHSYIAFPDATHTRSSPASQQIVMSFLRERHNARYDLLEMNKPKRRTIYNIQPQFPLTPRHKGFLNFVQKQQLMPIRKAEQMETKWDSYFNSRENYVYFTRSWTGTLMYGVKIEFIPSQGENDFGAIRLVHIDNYPGVDPKEPSSKFYMTEEQEDDMVRWMGEWLIASFFLHIPFFPLCLPSVPQWVDDDSMRSWMFSLCGLDGVHATNEHIEHDKEMIERLFEKLDILKAHELENASDDASDDPSEDDSSVESDD
jgi:hypothetical protein